MSIHQTLDTRTGTGNVTAELAAALRRRGHHVDILSFERIRAAERLRLYLFPWYVASFINNAGPYDVLDLSSRDGWVFSLLERILPRNPRPAIIARSHGLEHLLHDARLRAARDGAVRLSWKYSLYDGGFRLCESRLSFALADAALFLNAGERDYAIAHLGIHPERAHCCKNGIGDTFIEAAEARRADVDVQPMNVAFIGRWSTLKGAPYLAAAMRGVLANHRSARLGLFGTSLDRAAVLGDFPLELHSRIDVVPSYPNASLPQLLTGYHIIAVPSLMEGFAVAPLEAMACGLVPVASAIPGLEAYIDGERNGVLVPPRNADALETAVSALLDDTPRWHELRARALASAVAHAWDRIAGEIETFYSHARSRATGIPAFRTDTIS